ncbi:hypothetical protein SALBM311S_02561 [Streptomyces alboniger]
MPPDRTTPITVTAPRARRWTRPRAAVSSGGSESGRGFWGAGVSGAGWWLEPGRQGVAHVFAFWESRAFYDSFMARSHDRLAAAQSGTFKDAQVKLFDYRFDVKTGFEPRFTDADLVRVAHCRVHEERAEHFTLMQEKVWNPAMAGSPGMIRGLFGQRRAMSSWCCRCGGPPPNTASTGPNAWSDSPCGPRRKPTSPLSRATSWSWNAWTRLNRDLPCRGPGAGTV